MKKTKSIKSKIRAVKFKDIIYAAIVIFLALVIVITSAVPVAAALETCSLKVVQSTNYLYMRNWAYPSERNGIHLATVSSGTYKGEPAYCIEFGKDMGESGISESVTEIEDIDAWNSFSTVQKLGIRDATIYGYPNFNFGVSNEAAQVATQLIVWEYSKGYRTSADGDDPTAGLDGMDSTIEAAINTAGFDVRQMYYISAVKTYSDIRTAYVGILNGIKNHHVRPSFNGDTIELEWSSTNSRYEATVTDSNKALSLYAFTSSDSSVKTSISGNKLTIYTSSPLDSSVKITLDKTTASIGGDIGFVPDNKDYNQTLVGRLTDPVTGYIKVKTASGNLKIQKDSEDGIIKDISFTVSGNGETFTVKTNSKGVAELNDIPSGSYTVKESTDTRYVSQSTQSVTVTTGGTASVSFSNELKKGNIEIQKDSEDDIIKGFTFSITGSDGTSFTATTDSSGIAKVDNLPVYDSNNEKITYTIEETNIPVRYIDINSQALTLKKDNTSEIKFNNILKKFNISLTKSDIEKTTPQGDATLAGAEYGIYKGDKLIDSYTTDSSGSFTTCYYVCGDDYTVKEISPSEGYLLDERVYKVNASASNFTLENNTVSLDVTEQVIRGNISIIKHSDDGSTGIETPETGATFQIYLKSAGSFAAAKESEKGTIVCDSDGYASSALFPYGIYTVHQTSGWDSTQYITDFDVYINSDNMTYKFLINNSEFFSYLKIVKADAETGKAIPLAGAGFEIYDSEGHRVSMQYTYPQVTTINTFYTNNEGYLITPEMLETGEYKLVEVAAPYGYVLNSSPVSFTISQDNSSTDTGVMVVMVKMNDVAQKGTIKISKIGETLSAIEESNGEYVFKYEDSALSGAVFDIYAAEDITTPDGTTRYKKGELVDEVTTSSNGTAESKELYLGRYKAVEKKAPETFVKSNEEYFAELTYDGEEVEVTSAALSVYNERVKFSVSLTKEMEENDIFGIGKNDEILSVKFGLFSAEKITASDSSTVPADGLIATGTPNEYGLINFDCDLPAGYSFYVKEIETDKKYILSHDKYSFNTTYTSNDNKIISIDAGGGTVENKLIYGNIILHKTDRETKEAVEGALFGLFSYEETNFAEKEAYLTAKSGQDGIARFENIPYGDWIIYELESANGYLKNDEIHHVVLQADGIDTNINVVNDKVPELETEAKIDDEKTVCATEVFTLTDTVNYQHLIPGQEYTIDGILMNKKTEETLQLDGEEITSSVTFTPTASSGTVELFFTFDSKFIKEDTDIVAFESISMDGKELARHADIDDENQTVTVLAPRIKTEAAVSGEKEISATEVSTLNDTVYYENLTPGSEYIITGLLFDKNTNDALLIDGEEVTSEVSFIPEQTSGEITVKFIFDSKFIKEETDIVVFESLYKDKIEIADHSDAEDAGQTVHVLIPEIETTAEIDGEKQVSATEIFTLTDTVYYKNLTAGKEYKIIGILMNKATGEAFSEKGENITSTAAFTPATTSGSIDVKFKFDSKLIKEDTYLVAFETLLRDDIEIAVHKDIDDEFQTVTLLVPRISTLASVDGEKEIKSTETFTLTDTVKYDNLTPGKKYVLEGVLIDKTTGEPLLINGKEIISKLSFSPLEKEGNIDMSFEFDSRYISEKTDIVVYETLYRKNTEVAEHKDIDDKNQTVKVNIPIIGSEATVNGEKEALSADVCTLNDTVVYENLTVGREYTLKGTLMNKSTGKPLLINNKEVKSETSFTPEKEIGTVEVEFNFDSSLLTENTDIVVFEALYREDKEIAVHKDLEDTNQTVCIYVPTISTTAAVNGKKAANSGEEITIVDKVKYTDLIPGVEYTVSGILMDKSTKEEFILNDSSITSCCTFTPKKSAGSVNVIFTFDSSSVTSSFDLVVFESLLKGGIEIAEHKDIKDEDQTVSIVFPSVTHTVSDSPATGNTIRYSLIFTAAGLLLFGVIVLSYCMLKKRHKNKGGRK